MTATLEPETKRSLTPEELRRLRLFRQRFGLTQTRVAVSLQRATSWLSERETGQRPMTLAEERAVRQAIRELAGLVAPASEEQSL